MRRWMSVAIENADARKRDLAAKQAAHNGASIQRLCSLGLLIT